MLRLITPAESAIMQEHIACWNALMRDGLVIAFGPAAGLQGYFGIALVQLEDSAGVQPWGENGPAIKAGAAFLFQSIAANFVAKSFAGR